MGPRRKGTTTFGDLIVKPHGLLLATSLLLLSCTAATTSGPPTPTTGSSTPPRPTAGSTEAPSPTPEPVPTFPPPQEEVTTLGLVPLVPGRYRTAHFSPSLAVTVEAGWAPFADEATVWGLTRDNGYFTELSLTRYGGSVVTNYCVDPNDLEARPDLAALVVWLGAYPGLAVKEQPATSVGGYPARVLDLTFHPVQKCPNDKQGLASLWTTQGFDLGHLLSDGDAERVIFIEHPQGILILVLRTLPVPQAGPDLANRVVTLPDFIALAARVIQSLEFLSGS